MYYASYIESNLVDLLPTNNDSKKKNKSKNIKTISNSRKTARNIRASYCLTSQNKI